MKYHPAQLFEEKAGNKNSIQREFNVLYFQRIGLIVIYALIVSLVYLGYFYYKDTDLFYRLLPYYLSSSCILGLLGYVSRKNIWKADAAFAGFVFICSFLIALTCYFSAEGYPIYGFAFLFTAYVYVPANRLNVLAGAILMDVMIVYFTLTAGFYATEEKVFVWIMFGLFSFITLGLCKINIQIITTMLQQKLEIENEKEKSEKLLLNILR